MDIYSEFGIRKVINGEGTKTYLGGSIPDIRVMEALTQASQNFVIMMELLETAGRIISEYTGAEDSLITSCSSASMTLAVAASMMKGTELENFNIDPIERLSFDKEWLHITNILPHAHSLKNEVIIQKGHHNPFDNAYQVPGSKLIIIGNETTCSQDELKAAITPKTAAITFAPRYKAKGIKLEKIIEIGKLHDIPVILDAASELPPRKNLKKYISMGADLVIFSGGKHIGGPNDTGILCGRKDLIKLAKLQSAPYRGIGRGMKVDRTQIIGLLVALKLWLEKNEEAEFIKWSSKAKLISDEMKESWGVIKSDVYIEKERNRVFSRITLSKDKLDASEIVLKLRQGDPSIWLTYKKDNMIEIDPSNLKGEEEKIIISELKDALKSYY
jgi:uncharacterized pyridoxal phosphate-dependent enzyme